MRIVERSAAVFHLTSYDRRRSQRPSFAAAHAEPMLERLSKDQVQQIIAGVDLWSCSAFDPAGEFLMLGREPS
jgi:hypothetical protein